MIQEQVINYVLDTKDTSLIILNRIDEDFFPNYKAEWSFINNHFKTYGNIPDKETFLNSFPDFDLMKVNEPSNYLVEALYKEHQNNELAKTFNEVRKLLIAGDTDKAVDLYKQTYEKLSSSVPLTSIDILKDTSRYNDYVERLDAFDKYYVRTGLPELDALLGGWDREEELATIVARTNVGKCLAKGTKVLLADGSLKAVEDIKVGDHVQSLNKVNTVLALHNGVSKGYRIIPNVGEPFIISENHILTCMVRNDVLRKGTILHTSDNTFTLKDIMIEDYLKLSKNQQNKYLLYRPDISYEKKEQLIPPYILGLWLGDGTSCRVSLTNIDKEVIKEWCDWGMNYTSHIRQDHNTYDITDINNKGKESKVLNIFRSYNLLNNKHIPLDYLTGDKEQRLELLAGLLDTDGYLGKNAFSLCLKSKVLVEQTAQLARGLGFRVGKIKERILNNKVRGITSYYTISITGKINQIPTRIPKKQAKKSTSNRELNLTNFKVEEIDKIEYYGFMCDGDQRYLLWDNTLTHNTWLLLKFAASAAQQGLNVGIYSGEMSDKKVGYRIDTLIGHISNGALIHGSTTVEKEYKEYIESLPNRFRGSIKVLTPKMINGPAGVTALRAFIEKEHLDILFIDQHSLLEDDRKAKNPVERASNISKDLKNLQVLKRIPIISVSQQNRTSTENGVGSEHIAQSDRIAQDSTVILFFEKHKDDPTLLDINLVKSRDTANGKKLTYKVDFNKGLFTYMPGKDDEAVDGNAEYTSSQSDEDVF